MTPPLGSTRGVSLGEGRVRGATPGSILPRVNHLVVSRKALDGVEGAVLLAPAGLLRGNGSSSLRDKLEAELKDGARSVLLDLSRVDAADSACLGHFLDVQERLRARGGALILAALPAQVQVVFESIGLLGFFSVAESVTEAEAALRLGSDFGRSGSGSDLGRPPLS